MGNKKLTKQIIQYLVDKLGSKIEGKKKLMKLMFLIEHYDISKDKLTSETRIGNKFYIYHYGVFSLDVMNCTNELFKEKKLKDGFPLVSTQSTQLNKEIEAKVKQIIGKFGKMKGYDLEVKTLQMMGIEPYEKGEYFGQDVSKLIKS